MIFVSDRSDRDREPFTKLPQDGIDVSLSFNVTRALCATGYVQLRGVKVALNGEVILLRGSVPSYYMKQLAQAAALVVPGVREIRNELNVSDHRIAQE